MGSGGGIPGWREGRTGEDLAFTATGVGDLVEEDAQGGGRRGEGEERLTCHSRLLFLESHFTKEPRGEGLTEGPSGLGFRNFKKGDQRKKGHFNKVMGTSSQCKLCVHRQISFSEIYQVA